MFQHDKNYDGPLNYLFRLRIEDLIEMKIEGYIETDGLNSDSAPHIECVVLRMEIATRLSITKRILFLNYVKSETKSFTPLRVKKKNTYMYTL